MNLLCEEKNKVLSSEATGCGYWALSSQFFVNRYFSLCTLYFTNNSNFCRRSEDMAMASKAGNTCRGKELPLTTRKKYCEKEG
jgi:hypothetical protein